MVLFIVMMLLGCTPVLHAQEKECPKAKLKTGSEAAEIVTRITQFEDMHLLVYAHDQTFTRAVDDLLKRIYQYADKHLTFKKKTLEGITTSQAYVKSANIFAQQLRNSGGTISTKPSVDISLKALTNNQRIMLRQLAQPLTIPNITDTLKLIRNINHKDIVLCQFRALLLQWIEDTQQQIQKAFRNSGMR